VDVEIVTLVALAINLFVVNPKFYLDILILLFKILHFLLQSFHAVMGLLLYSIHEYFTAALLTGFCLVGTDLEVTFYFVVENLLTASLRTKVASERTRHLVLHGRGVK
jgi:hypothetical protein